MSNNLSAFARAVVEFSQRRGLFLSPPDAAPEMRTIVALSGGPDSCALLLALLEIADAGLLPRPVAAAHFHHGLRGADADQDAAFCAALCARFHLPCLIGLGAVPKTGRGSYSNDAARRLRYAFLEEAAQEIGANALATAHTADDQAETILGRVLRGTSVDGLAGIPARRALSPDLIVIRPLLTISRPKVEEYCAAAGITPRCDPSNDKEIFPRVRLRHRLPELARDFNPRLGDALRRLSDHAVQDSDFLTHQADALWESSLLFIGPLSLRLNRAALQNAHPALRRRVLLRALRHITRDSNDAAEAAATHNFVARLETLLETGKNAVSLPGRSKAQISKDALILQRPEPDEPASDYQIALPVPGTLTIPESGLRLTLHLRPANDGPIPAFPRSQQVAFAFDAPMPLLIRPLRPGERIAPLGMNGKTRPARELMAENNWPAADRAAAPLIANAQTNEPLWIIGLVQSEATRITPETKNILVLLAEPAC